MFAITPTLSAMTSFLKKPQTIRTVASRAAAGENVPLAARICGSRFVARMIGPATRCGKNDTNAAMSMKRVRAGAWPRYTSIV